MHIFLISTRHPRAISYSRLRGDALPFAAGAAPAAASRPMAARCSAGLKSTQMAPRVAMAVPANVRGSATEMLGAARRAPADELLDEELLDEELLDELELADFGASGASTSSTSSSSSSAAAAAAAPSPAPS